MEYNVYKGTRNNPDNQYYYINLNTGIDGTKIKDELGNNLVFVEHKICSGEIKKWKPFTAIYKSYDGKQRNVTFTCPTCGSHDCERENDMFSDPYFFEDNFKCSKCGASGFCYYSDCFNNNVKQVMQLELNFK